MPEGHSIADLVRQLRALGVAAGDILLTHVSLRAIGPVAGGPVGLIESLGCSIGPRGTLVMPSWTDSPDQPFDPNDAAPAASLGAVARTFWQLPGVVRDHSPFAFAARGPEAASILAGGLLLPPHQPGSPTAEVMSRNGKILLLGVNHDANTTLHLAEWLADVPYRQPAHVTVLRDGHPIRLGYFEHRHCFRLFTKVDTWLDEAGMQVKGVLGRTTARLVRSRDLVDIVVDRLRKEPFSFLHPPNAGCPACEAAWRSVR